MTVPFRFRVAPLTPENFFFQPAQPHRIGKKSNGFFRSLQSKWM
jgi:hypothetical protein